MAYRGASAFVIMLLAGPMLAQARSREQEETSPLTKTMELLSDLEGKIIKEGEVAQKEYEEYSEWCSDKAKDLQYEIKTAKAQVAELKATIAKEASIIESLTAKIEETAGSIASEEKDLKEATALREEQHADFAAEEKELTEIVSTLERAIRIISKEAKGGSASMLQLTRMPNILSAFDAMVQASVLSTADGSKLAAFLQDSSQAAEDDAQDPGAPAAAVYETHSGGVLEILESLLEKAEEQLDTLRKSETTAVHNFELLKQSLEDEMKVAKKELADAKTGVAAAEEAKSVADGDLEVTSKDLASDVKELNDAHHSCQSTAEDFEAAVTERGEELKALAEAKKAISESTGAAETLTYGLDQVSFLQRRQQQGGTNFAVVRFVRGLARKQGSTQLAQFANRLASTIRFSARVGQDPFAKVKGLISELIASLEASAEADASHKSYCDKETKETTEKKADKSSEVAKLTTAIDKMTARIATLEEEVAELQKELANLAKAQAEYQAWYTKAEETYTTNKADLEAGLAGVKKALQVLGDYYAKGGANEGSASGIIGLLEVVESDFSKGLTETEAGFTNIKMEFEAFAKEAELTTATKDQDVKYKSEEITSLKKSLGETTSDRKGVQTELDAILEYLSKINDMCIAKAEPYAEKKARREAEIAGLNEALSVLEGEAVLLQRGSRRAMRTSLRGVARHFAA